MRRRLLLLLLLAVLLQVVGLTAALATDVTFLVASDTHFTGKSLPKVVKPALQAMNGHVVGLAYPTAIGGTVATPFAALVLGNLCDGGAGIGATDTPRWYSPRNFQDQWTGFSTYFPSGGVTGDINRLRFASFATAGNHDFYNNFGTALSAKSYYVANALQARYAISDDLTNGNVYYAFDVDGVHVVALGRWGGPEVLSWLTTNLASIPAGTPVVLYLHYAFDDGQTWYTDAERQRLAQAIAPYRVIAILHGHTHSSGHYVWNGYDCYDDGSMGYNSEFGVLHITSTTLTYSQYRATGDSSGNWKSGQWTWWHSKALPSG